MHGGISASVALAARRARTPYTRHPPGLRPLEILRFRAVCFPGSHQGESEPRVI
jgi:hypothetical protein